MAQNEPPAYYTQEDIETFSYYADSVFAERIRSLTADWRHIPYWFPTISAEGFEERIVRYSEVLKRRDTSSFELPDVDENNIYSRAAQLESFATQAEEQAAIKAEADRVAREETKRLKGLAQNKKK